MIQGKFRDHLDLSKRQVEALERCLKNLGSNSSTMKDLTTKLSSLVQAYSTALAPDELVKQLLAAHAWEHFEMASYRSLVAAAEDCGEAEVARVCEDYLRQEAAMADWIDQQIPVVTREYLRTVH